MNSERFLELYTNFYGEKVDNLEQICVAQFTGHELMSFIDYVLFAEQLKENDAAVVLGVKPDTSALREAIARLHKMGKEVVIIASNEIKSRPMIVESEPIIIEKLPEIKEPYLQKERHSPKGHERPYKYHP